MSIGPENSLSPQSQGEPLTPVGEVVLNATQNAKGGWGGPQDDPDPAHLSQYLRLLTRAVAHNWPIEDKIRRSALATALRIMASVHPSENDAAGRPRFIYSAREVIAATRLIAAMNESNNRLAIALIKASAPAIQVQVNQQLNVGVKYVQDMVREMEANGQPLVIDQDWITQHVEGLLRKTGVQNEGEGHDGLAVQD